MPDLDRSPPPQIWLCVGPMLSRIGQVNLAQEFTICGGRPDFIEPPQSAPQEPQNMPLERHKSPDLFPVLNLAQYRKVGEPAFTRDFRARNAPNHPYALSEGAPQETAGPVLCWLRRCAPGPVMSVRSFPAGIDWLSAMDRLLWAGRRMSAFEQRSLRSCRSATDSIADITGQAANCHRFSGMAPNPSGHVTSSSGDRPCR